MLEIEPYVGNSNGEKHKVTPGFAGCRPGWGTVKVPFSKVGWSKGSKWRVDKWKIESGFDHDDLEFY